MEKEIITSKKILDNIILVPPVEHKEVLTNNISYTPGTASCGNECHLTKEYGFVPEAGCEIHDV